MSEILSRVGRQYARAEGPSVSIVATAHRAASTESKELVNWRPSPGSADADLIGELPVMVPRSRDIIRNNGMAAGMVQTSVDNIVGTGFRLIPSPQYWRLGWTWEQSEKWRLNVQSRWEDYYGSTEVDAADELTGDGLCSQVIQDSIGNGEALALPVWLPRKNSQFSTRIQMVESDRLCNPDNRMDSDNLRGGVEIDEYGQPLAYWIRSAHPGDWFGFMSASSLSARWVRVPRKTSWGRRRVLHMRDKERTGQTRGKPLLASVLPDFKMLDHFQRATLKSAVVHAMISAFIETPMGSSEMAQMVGSDTTSEQFQQYLTARREYVGQLQGGAIIPVYPGDSVKPFTPTQPTSVYDSFCKSLSRSMGLPLGLPLELSTRDYSETTFSGARASLSEAFRHFLGRRKFLANVFLHPLYSLWLEEQVNAGNVEAPDFYENKALYCSVKVRGPGRGYIDPTKDVEAAEHRIQIGISTLEQEAAEQGNDWQEVAEQQSRERQFLADLSIKDRNWVLARGGKEADLMPLDPKNPPPQEQQEQEQQAA